MKKYIDYTKHIGGDEHLIKWVNSTLKNYLEKNKSTTEEVEHILDYLAQSNKKLERMSYDEAKNLTDKWNKSLIKKGSAIKEVEKDTEVILDFKDGFKVVKLIGKNAYKREGFLMRHCVASYFGKAVEVYSLRDKNNMPHCTMEKDQQIKGKGNGDIHPKYIEYVVKFLEKMDMRVGDSEMKHLGYYNFEKVKKYLHKDTDFYNKVYLQKDAKLIGKDKKEFVSLDLLDVKPLIEEESDNKLKVNFKLESFIKLSIDFLWKNNKSKVDDGHYSKLATSGHSSQLATSGDSSQLATSGDSSQLATSGDYSQLATSGDYSQLATSGHSSQLATSGDSSKLATSGDSSKLATSGDYSKLATSGHSSQLATSGDYSQLATSGDYSQLATSGHSSQLATSGHSSQLATSGHSSQLAISGKYSVGANIGRNGKIKGIKGTWITLAEYDNDWKIIYVKSAIIDGKKLKENTWYKLKNKKFVEINN